ncbi:unnamed protein product [Parascedosporium putredinis]|uniref:Hydrophobin n=1 Tax=Parascedosporium putredinis TaxID=1442378 RepID=A0A9P1GYT0_9PEZI|nr:unnamed protein product [Parascedosporium putredinis]CAI7991067.1 unnamed protein product [Parascedosporium putredinis]
MQFRVVTIIALAASEATNQCGNGQELKCCNKNLGAAGSGNGGLVSALNGLTLVDECSSLSVTGLIGVSDLLKSHCKQTVVCCNAGSTQQNGLVNIAPPIQCLSINGLV